MKYLTSGIIRLRVGFKCESRGGWIGGLQDGRTASSVSWKQLSDYFNAIQPHCLIYSQVTEQDAVSLYKAPSLSSNNPGECS